MAVKVYGGDPDRAPFAQNSTQGTQNTFTRAQQIGLQSASITVEPERGMVRTADGKLDHNGLTGKYNVRVADPGRPSGTMLAVCDTAEEAETIARAARSALRMASGWWTYKN